RTEQRRVLAQQRVHVEAGTDVVGRIDGADLDRAAAVGGIDLAQVLGRRGIDQRAWDRIARNAAAEPVDLSGQLLFLALAHEVDVGEDAAAVAAPVLALVADAGEQPSLAGLDLDLAADLA